MKLCDREPRFSPESRFALFSTIVFFLLSNCGGSEDSSSQVFEYLAWIDNNKNLIYDPGDEPLADLQIIAHVLGGDAPTDGGLNDYSVVTNDLGKAENRVPKTRLQILVLGESAKVGDEEVNVCNPRIVFGVSSHGFERNTLVNVIYPPNSCPRKLYPEENAQTPYQVQARVAKQIFPH